MINSPGNFQAVSERILEQGREAMRATHARAIDTVHAQGLLVIRHQPHRRDYLKMLRQPGCPFCRDQATEFLEEHRYHGMLLSQNLGPYGPLSLILRTRLHHEQGEIIDFLKSHGRKWASDLPPGITLFCNQLAGNSQKHLHLQYLDRLLPVERIANADKSPIALRWHRTQFQNAEYTLINDKTHSQPANSKLPIKHFLGCLLRGNAVDATNAAIHYLQSAQAQGFSRFNFALWREAQSERLVYFIALRNPETIRRFDSEFPILVGALTTCGLVTEERLPEQMPPFDYPAFVKFMKTKLFNPISPWDKAPRT